MKNNGKTMLAVCQSKQCESFISGKSKDVSFYQKKCLEYAKNKMIATDEEIEKMESQK